MVRTTRRRLKRWEEANNMATPTKKEFVAEVEENPIGAVINKQKLGLIGVGLALFVGLLMLHSIVGTNNAGFITVRQAAGSGTLTAYTTPGMFPRFFGDTTVYKQSDIIYFSKHDNEGGSKDDSVEVRFNDGATASVTGNVRIDLPADPAKVLEIHKVFRSYDSLIKDTVRQVIGESTILTAALMTAEESYTTKRAEFSQMVDDQIRNGVYLTEAKQIEVKDKATGETVIKNIVSIQRDVDTKLPLRKESPFAKYGIRVSQAIVKEIDYEKTVADQIQTKQQALMQVVSAKANAEKAIQDRLTAEEVGRKNVAVAKYDQEVKKATAVTQAEQLLDVARLNRSTEEQNKAANIAKGEGEGEYRRKVMQADGALQQKLDAYVKTQQAWAEAFANSKNPVVPGVVMGGGNGGNGNNAALNLMEVMGVKAAKDLALDLTTHKQ